MDRDDLHDLVISMKEKLVAGRLVLRDPVVLRELSEVRFANDGKVDPATVGSSVRALLMLRSRGREPSDGTVISSGGTESIIRDPGK